MSEIEEQLEVLQRNERLKFVILGDSAYSRSDYIVTGEGLRGLASVREPIEWEYKDLKVLWKYCDYKKALQLRKQPLAKIFFVCMLLRNAHCCMNGSQCSVFFGMPPPSFEEWTSQGPRAHPIPDNSIFSPNFVRPDYRSDSDTDSDSDSD